MVRAGARDVADPISVDCRAIKSMTPLKFIRASLSHHRRIHLAVFLGVAVATAVLSGALLVGDSVRGSLRELTLERLGKIDEVLVAGHFFRDALADELASASTFQQRFTAAEPAILIPGTLQSGSGNDARRATRVSVIGVQPAFWSLGQGGPEQPLADGEIAIVESLAEELAAEVGDSVLVRIATAGAIPADSPLGEKSDTSMARRLKIAAVLPPTGLARFGLIPSQHWPRNAFVPLATLQDMLDKPGGANVLLVAGDDAETAPDEAAEDALGSAFQPKIADLGLRVEHVASPTDYIELSSEQLVLSDDVVEKTKETFADVGVQGVVTYLANTIVAGEGDARRQIPYSTITGVDSIADLGPLLDDAGQPIQLGDDEIALNRWAADDLEVKLGDMISINYYEPESTHGVLREHEPPARFRLVHIAELELDGQRTPAADPKFTPELPGVTDQASINDWDLPFELVEPIRQHDEDYWDKYSTTPKAFVSLATAKHLWASRWGTFSLVRIPTAANAATADAVEIGFASRLLQHLAPDDVGMKFLSVKRIGLAASSGTTPFDGLFLGFSLFLIAAAVMLIAVLFRLGIEQRAGELGILAAIGLRRRQISKLLSREGLIVAACGAVLGIVVGIGYAWLMITGLRTWWVAAISTPFLSLHITPRSLAIGWLVGVVVSWLTIRWSIRRLARLPAGRLLAGDTEADAMQPTITDRKSSWSRIREALLALAVALGIAGFLLKGEAQAGAFFGTGAVVLALLLGEVRYRLRAAGRQSPSRQTFNLTALSALNTARRPGRSTLTIGLVATATFLIVAISAFRLDSGVEGTGGFALLATSDQPIHFNLNTPSGQTELGLSDETRMALADWHVYSLRMAAGEDASCLNLYRPTQPRVLGVPDALIERGGFGWADAADVTGAQVSSENPWTLLRADLGHDESGRAIVPVVLDAATAIYSLHLAGVGGQLTIQDDTNRPVTLEVVGLLKNSVLQGNLLASESNFLKMFPDTGGYRFFLLEADATANDESVAISNEIVSSERNSPSGADAIAQMLESTLAAEGFDAIDAREQLAEFLAVQNTYLSTFQMLGALGLLLGTVGLAVVQLRSVLERRAELALMQAAGFRPSRLEHMVIAENGVLLVGGLLVGIAAAVVALVPQWAPHGVSVPWLALFALLGTIALVGLAAGWLATRSALDAPLVAALRGD